jgi:putative intracellular protease/amidase
MLTAYLLYDRFTALDVAGPHEVLASVPGAESVFVAERPGPVRSDHGALTIGADHAFDEVTAPDVVVVPGGIGTPIALGHEPTIAWIRRVHENTEWTISVCTGAQLLAAAGLLDDAPATTYWLARDRLASQGAKVVDDRVVRHGKILTSAGVSSGIDMALRLVQLMHGDEVAQAVQLGIEYDPDPPVHAGSPEKTAPAIAEAVRGVFAAREAEALASARQGASGASAHTPRGYF